MADHAVGGIDRLVGRHAGQAATSAPKYGRHHAIREVLRGTLDGRAADAGLVEESRITTNDLRDRHAPGIDTPRSSPPATAAT